jgi:arabinogalactan endo-1,4-beta-galactosidase
MKFYKIFLILVLIMNLLACKNDPSQQKKQNEFIIGADLSVLDKYLEYGGQYSEDGQIKDPLEIFKNGDYNYVRLRLFHTPNMKGPTCQSLEYVTNAAQKVKKAGMKFLLDIHYSDTWAGPGHQTKPAVWNNCNYNQLVDSIYSYTNRVINVLGENGAAPDMVQIGNEINGGMVWPEGKIFKTEGEADYVSLSEFLKAGIKGVKDSPFGKDTEILIHLARGGDFPGSKRYLDSIIAHGVEFDVIGESYYPWWHGTFDDLENNLKNLSETYSQKIVIAETSYFWKPPYFGSRGTSSDNQPFPLTIQGQVDYMNHFYSILKKYPKVAGFFYWFPEAVEIDSASGLKYANRSFFDEKGNALPGIYALKDLE